ncbi:MAG: DUF6265 family protein [Vicinamibacterales bacterium]
MTRRGLGTLAGRMGMLGVVATLAGGGPAGAAGADLPRWMAGCWSGSRDGETFTERWITADAATLIGTSHTVKDGALTGFEFLRVVVKGGVPVYVAQPGGAPPTEFTATSESAEAVVFENPSHDFPKRVGYRRVDPTHLTAWIDGGAGATGPRLEFAMTRCE